MAGTIRLYIDEHVSKAVAYGLRQRGVDVLTTAEAAMLAAPDEEQLALALSGGRVIVSQDVDFLRLHASGSRHAGIIFGPQGTTTGDMIRGIMLVVEVLGSDEMLDHVEFV